jgi:hypothetical protein
MVKVLPLVVVSLLLCAVAASCSNAPPDYPATGGLLAVMPSGTTIRKGGSFGIDRTQVISDEDERFPRILRVFFPAGSGSERSANHDNTPEGGAQAYLPYQKATDQAYLRYYVRFPVGFDFVKGGKLPGLYGGTRTAGRKVPDGTDGLSTRYMWRRDGDGEIYAYLPTSHEHGTSIGRGEWRFRPGQWTSLEQRVQLNTPGGADGRITVWVDGRQVLDERGLSFRTTSTLQIEGIFFSTFFGGGDKSWATPVRIEEPVSQYVDFADFRVGPTAIGPTG